MANDTWTGGLEGIPVADSQLSRVDGEAGRLILRGYDIQTIAEVASYEGVCALLWSGEPPDGVQSNWQEQLARGRQRAFEDLHRVGHALAAEDGMDALRGAMGLQSSASEDDVQLLGQITGAAAVFVAAWARKRRGEAPLPPDSSLDHASDYLRMVTGRRDRLEADAMRRYFVTVSEHGMNASTFAARVVTSTGSDPVSAIVGAVGALKGPLHGGAPGRVLDTLDAASGARDVETWLRGEIEAGRRIMGMGHRVYRVRDPRTYVLERAVEGLKRDEATVPRLEQARRLESLARQLLAERHPGRPLHANVEFYTAILLEALGLERGELTPTFAVARSVGWCAHIREQRATGRLIRPTLRYVGPMPAAAA